MVVATTLSLEMRFLVDVIIRLQSSIEDTTVLLSTVNNEQNDSVNVFAMLQFCKYCP